MKRCFVSLLVTVALIVTLIPVSAIEANAATSEQDKLITHARSHLGDKYNTFDDRSAFSGDWCSAFIQHCSSKAGLSSIIPTSGCSGVGDMARTVANKKGGEITFVNKSFYDNKKSQYNSGTYTYNYNYKPRKGDFIIFSSDAYEWYTHIGIVTADSSYPRKQVKTIEGNTGGNSYRTSTVKEQTRESFSGFYIVAYVTPNYQNSAWVDSLEISTKEDTGKPYLTWSKRSGAAKYYVYRATGKNGNFQYLNWTSGTTFTNTSAKAGTYYRYYIKAVDSNGKRLQSTYAKDRTCDLARPVITTSCRASDGKPVVSWDSVQNADRYYVYKAATKNSSYTKVNSTTGTSYTDTSTVVGKTYYYKVKAICDDNSGANSAYSAVDWRVCDLSRPSIVVSGTKKPGKIVISWKKVPSADRYYLYRATSKNGTYKYYDETTETSYTNSSVTKGKYYYYKVRAVYDDKEGANSAYSNMDYAYVR